MKILYDHQTFTLQEYGGISNYFSKLYDNLNSIESIDVNTTLKFSNNIYIKESNNISAKSFFSVKSFRGRYRVQNFLNKIESIKQLKKGDYDIFHPTYYDPYFLKYIKNKPFVLTIFDMTHEKYIKNPKDKIIEWKKNLAAKADRIIAISQNTKNDIIEILGVKDEKISVIHLSESISGYNIVKPEINIPDKYLLFIGLRNGYKNFVFFLKSIASILQNDQSLFLLCIGGGIFNQTEKSLIRELKLNERIKQYTLENKYLPFIYKNAKIFIFPSLYEGFGIPVLEAYSNDCPAALSNYGSIPEVGGDCAVYFDPKRENTIRESILKLLNSDKLRQELSIKGKKRAKNFSWEICAKETENVYKRVLKINN